MTALKCIYISRSSVLTPDKAKTIQTSVHLPRELHTKARTLALANSTTLRHLLQHGLGLACDELIRRQEGQ